MPKQSRSWNCIFSSYRFFTSQRTNYFKQLMNFWNDSKGVKEPEIALTLHLPLFLSLNSLFPSENQISAIQRNLGDNFLPAAPRKSSHQWLLVPLDLSLLQSRKTSQIPETHLLSSLCFNPHSHPLTDSLWHRVLQHHVLQILLVCMANGEAYPPPQNAQNNFI